MELVSIYNCEYSCHSVSLDARISKHIMGGKVKDIYFPFR